MARLKAQRDLLRRMKEEKRQEELKEFNAQMSSAATGQPNKNLAAELRQLDANKQLPQTSNPELDRRRMIYKNIRKEINEADEAAKQRQYAEKMQRLETKVQQREAERKVQA